MNKGFIEKKTWLDGMPVTLGEMLHARDVRAERQRNLLSVCPDHPIISLTIVIPGSIKQSRGTRFLFRMATEAFFACCLENSWQISEEILVDAGTGYEALWQTDQTDALFLKKMLLTIEESHPLGRLWDFDIVTSEGPVSRQALGYGSRPCLICHDQAHSCARSQRHDIEELISVIETLINLNICSVKAL